MKDSPIPSWEKLSNDPNVRLGDSWKTYVLCAYGFFFEENCKKCPNTTWAVKKIRGVKTAWFSILEPNTTLPEHAGPYNGVLRYHLGLVIPNSNSSVCGIKVGNDLKGWEEGKSLIFDDSHPHSAWNLSNNKRVVLFVDFIRPLPFPLSLVNKFVILFALQTGFMKKVISNIKKSQK
jgi:beta-hydroxylase